MSLKKEYKRAQPTLRNPNRICVICNEDYKAVAPLQKTCSNKCKDAKNKVAQKSIVK